MPEKKRPSDSPKKRPRDINEERPVPKTTQVSKTTQVPRTAPRKKKKKKPLSRGRRILKRVLEVLLGFFLVLFLVGGIYGFVRIRPLYTKAKEQVYDIIANMNTGSFRRQTNTSVYDKNGELIGKLGYEHYDYIDITEISDYIQQGYIDVEDKRFKSHHGVDWIATFRAGLELIRHGGHITQGGSTITQQVIKNNLLTAERSFDRKALEILIASQLEKEFTKADIMEFYCNSNYYGNSCYGVEGAAQYYFGVNANSVDLAQAAMIVGISNSPNNYNPVVDYELCMKKKERVLGYMLKQEHITQEEYDEAVKERPEILKKSDNVGGQSYETTYAVHDAAILYMKHSGFEFKYTFESEEEYTEYKDKYSEAYNEAAERIREGGYKINTSFDSSIQEHLQNAIDGTLAGETDLQDDGRYDMQGAGVCIDNETGQVVAAVGGRGLNDEFNRAYLAKRSAGSSIKPLVVYGPALNEGVISPATIYNDAEIDINGYAPKNSDGQYFGNVTVREALARSLNTVAAQIFTDTGSQRALGYLDKMQFSSLSFGDAYNTAIALGGFTNGVTVEDMTRAYAAIANDGVLRDSTCIRSIVSETEGTIYDYTNSEEVKVFNADTSFILKDMMQGVFNEDYGTGAAYRTEEQCFAGKTGTTNENRDGWFAGFSTSYTAVIWTGCDTPKSNPHLAGNEYPLAAWSSFMNAIHTGKEKKEFNLPETILLTNAGGEQMKPEYTENIYASRPEGWDYTSGELIRKVEENARLRRVAEEKEAAESLVREFEDYQIENVDDAIALEDYYNRVLNTISAIEDDAEQTPFKERAEYKYSLLAGDVKQNWIDAMKAEDQAAQDSLDAANAAAASESSEEALRITKTQRINTVNVYIDTLNARTVLTASVQNLISGGQSALAMCAGYPEFEELSQELNAAIAYAQALPTEAEVARQQAEAEAAAAQAAALAQSSQDPTPTPVPRIDDQR